MAERPADIEALESELRGLGNVLLIPPPDGLVEAVMTRLEDEPIPVAAGWWNGLLDAASAAGRWLRERWRVGTAVLAGALLVLLLVSPAGAAVRQWLGFGAVVVVQEQAPPPSAVPPPSAPTGTGGSQMSLAQARAAVPFALGVPASLGPPTLVTVSGDARLASMTWSDGTTTIRLDQIGGAADPYFVKRYYSDIEFTEVHGREALWLIRPHPIVVLAPDGEEIVASARQSGPVLLWQSSGVTLRLEGVQDQERAVAIAASVAP